MQCSECGVKYTSKRGPARYCSARCKVRAYKNRLKSNNLNLQTDIPANIDVAFGSEKELGGKEGFSVTTKPKFGDKVLYSLNKATDLSPPLDSIFALLYIKLTPGHSSLNSSPGWELRWLKEVYKTRPDLRPLFKVITPPPPHEKY